MLYEYPTKELAQAAINDGTAMAFFKPFLDIALANVPEADRVEWFETDYRVIAGERTPQNTWSRKRTYMAYLHFDEGLKRSSGQVSITMRKDGTVNQENLNQIVYLICTRRSSTKRRMGALQANRAAIESLPEVCRPYVRAETSEGIVRLDFDKNGVRFSRAIPISEVEPILTVLLAASAKIDAIRFPHVAGV